MSDTVKNGKGDWKRPVDSRKWDKGYDAIRWPSKAKQKRKGNNEKQID